MKTNRTILFKGLQTRPVSQPRLFSASRYLLLTGLALSAVGSSAQAQNHFEDDFEAGFNNWTAQTVNNGCVLATDRNAIPAAGVNSVKIGRSDDRSAINMSSALATNVPALFTVYINADSLPTSTTGPSRVQSAVGPNSFAGTSVGIGWFNNATGKTNNSAGADVFIGGRYQGKHPGVGGNGWINLTDPGVPTRTNAPGVWRRFDVERVGDNNNKFLYYVDNIVGREVDIQATNSTWNSVILGFGSGTQVGDAWYDGVRVTTKHPSLLQQPTNAFASLGGTVVFSVNVTNYSDVPDDLTYQWKFNVTNDIVGATNSSWTVLNVDSNHIGFYSVVVSNTYASIGSRAASLSIAVPGITANSQSREVLQGAYTTNTVTANGQAPLFYQWKLNGTNILNATGTAYALPNVQTNAAGNYSVTVSNSFGVVTATNIILTVVPKPTPAVLSVLWEKKPGDFPWFVANATSATARGMAYSPVSNHVYVVSRQTYAAGAIYVLDGETGAQLYEIQPDTSLVAGGTFAQSLIQVGTDGAIYTANLTLDGSTTPLRIYRYTSYPVDGGSSIITPEVVWEGDPTPGIVNRWGDAMDVRGSGETTEILLSSRNKTNFVILTPLAGGPYPTPTVINAINAKADDYGLGVAFGSGNTIWAKVNGKSLVQLDYSGNILHSFTNHLLPVSVIAVDPVNNRLVGNGIETPDNLRLFDIANLASEPVLLDYSFYNSPNKVGSFGTGGLDFGNGRVYGFSENQSIKAVTIGSAPAPTLSIVSTGGNVVLTWTGAYTLQSATALTGSPADWSDVGGNPASPATISAAGAAKFYRLRN